MEQRNWEARCCVLYRQPRGCAFSLRKVHTGKAAPVRKGISPQNHDESKLFVSLTVMTGVSHNCIILKITTQHQYLSRPPHGSTSSRLGGLQSNKSKASVLHGPISLSTTGLAIGDSTSFGGSILVSTVKLCVLTNFFRGSVFLMSAARPDFFLAATAGGSGASGVSTGSVSVDLGRFLFSQSSLVLGIGASFSLRTRLNLRFGDMPGVSPSSSMGSVVLVRFLGFCSMAASSVVVITGPFLLARRG